MGNVLVKSPQEHASETARYAEREFQLVIQRVPRKPAPGHIRVHFYSHLYQVYDGAPPDMTADFPLCPRGGLDVNLVKGAWGLETCTPVDPLRWKPVEPTHVNYLSPVALRVLSEEQDGCIKVIEPFVSQTTLIQRQTRHAILATVTVLYVICARWLDLVYQCLETDTTLIAHLRRSKRRLAAVTIDWEAVVTNILLAAWGLLVYAYFNGNIAANQRLHNWARTGSLSL
ncbi:unnamed protein product [Mycena citricolor]|uniref:Uncharacterized protein n=1 Tax=Mycena citricolor TaxID=2018698 RepID=A0AAD2H8X3_9AGAR|nr:unnamed protein product [Mycena citricolor]CAK5284152.1 unnamed protein product [Mycena citricolor]